MANCLKELGPSKRTVVATRWALTRFPLLAATMVLASRPAQAAVPAADTASAPCRGAPTGAPAPAGAAGAPADPGASCAAQVPATKGGVSTMPGSILLQARVRKVEGLTQRSWARPWRPWRAPSPLAGVAGARAGAGNGTSVLGQAGVGLRQAPDDGESQVMMFSNIMCGESLFAPTGNCPKNCPFFAEQQGQDKVCHFQCVPADDCGSLDPTAIVADTQGMFCRPCKVLGCERCVDEPVDKCAKCATGYIHARDGHCYSAMWVAWIVVFAIAGVVGLFLLAWYADLRRRPAVNEAGLAEGLAFRSRLKLRMPKGCLPPREEQPPPAPAAHAAPPPAASPPAAGGASYGSEGGRPLWPLSTSLHNVPVAGPGLLLHFNFHIAVILWGCVCVSCWIVFAYCTEPELLLLGLYSANSPQTLCSVTLRGKAAQKDMMWAKVIFLIMAYLGTVVGSLAYALFHVRRYQELDANTTSMRDFAVFCTGLPRLAGAGRVEEELAQQFWEVTGQTVVGVSICWDFRTHAVAVRDALDQDASELEPEAEPAEDARMGGSRVAIFRRVDALLGFPVGGVGPAEAEAQATSAEDLAKGAFSSDAAFLVFETEFARNAALEAAQRAGGVRFQEAPLRLQAAPNEPDTVCWDIFSVDAGRFVARSCAGVATVLLAVAVWCMAFFLPYAYYTASFVAAHNEEPSLLSGLTFSMLVVAGNQAMYFLCNEIAYRVGFRFSDHAETFYIALYTFACFLNLVVDLVLEAWLGYSAMVAAGAHTADGRLLGDLESYQEIFESYPMQKALGKRLFDYCFPSAFFIPFVFEPIFAIYLPYHIMKLLVRSHGVVRGRAAEKSLDFFTRMDLTRYGDLVLNVILTSLSFFFPAGEMLKLFLALITSHCFVYAYDKYRVLRAVPGFCFAGDSVDLCAQAVLAIPCGFMAACAVFKGNCLEFAPFRMHERNLAAACTATFVLHVAFHWLLLFRVVPAFRPPEKPTAEQTYAQAAHGLPCTWFTANPMHCLRSRHVYGHSPPCALYVRGREHLMRANPAIGCYFEEPTKDGVEEDYTY